MCVIWKTFWVTFESDYAEKKVSSWFWSKGEMRKLRKQTVTFSGLVKDLIWHEADIFV